MHRAIPIKAIYAAWLGLGLVASMAYALPTDSTDSTLTTSTYNLAKTLVLEQGYINAPISGGEQQQFNTTQKCPTGFNAIVDLRMSKIAANGTDVIIGFGTCVNYVTTNATNHTVGFLVSRRYYSVYNQGNSNFYIGTSDSMWTDGNGNPNNEPMFPTAAINVNPTYDYDKIGGFYWTLYCYNPSGAGTPSTLVPYPVAPATNSCWGGQAANGSTNPY